MAKQRKTRSQKQIADLRRIGAPTSSAETDPVTHASNYEFRFTPTNTGPSSLPKTAAITIANYSFVMSDLRRTLILTLTIIAIQLILFFITK